MIESTGRMAAPAVRVSALFLLLTVLSSLFYYKWGASLRVYEGFHATGALAVHPDVLLRGNPWSATFAYFGKIWPALLFGVTIGAVVRNAIPPAWVARALGGHGLRGALVGGLAGAPLMLCSCCVTPIFTGLYERGARLSSALAVMLGAPGLNLAAIVLTFALIPAKLAVARTICAVAIVLGVPAMLARLKTDEGMRAACAVAPPPAAPLDSHLTQLAAIGVLAGVITTAAISVLVALPTFFEIPVAILLLQLGAPAGTAVAVLVAGPIVNLPSLLVLGRETRPRIALAVGGVVWAVATGAGILTSL